MPGKWKKRLKKVAKAAVPVLGALALAKGLGKKRKSVSEVGQDAEDINIGKPFRHDLESYKPKFKYKPYDPSEDKSFYAAAKGGRIGAKKGGHVKSMGVAKRGGGVAKR